MNYDLEYCDNVTHLGVKSDEGDKKEIISTVISDRYVASNYRRDAHSFALKSKSEVFHPSETTDTGTRIKSKLKEEERKEKQEYSKKLCEESKDSISESDSKHIVAIYLLFGGLNIKFEHHTECTLT